MRTGAWFGLAVGTGLVIWRVHRGWWRWSHLWQVFAGWGLMGASGGVLGGASSAGAIAMAVVGAAIGSVIYWAGAERPHRVTVHEEGPVARQPGRGRVLVEALLWLLIAEGLVLTWSAVLLRVDLVWVYVGVLIFCATLVALVLAVRRLGHHPRR